MFLYLSGFYCTSPADVWFQHYTMLYYTILHYTTLHYTILYYTIPYYTILYCTMQEYYPVPKDRTILHLSKTVYWHVP